MSERGIHLRLGIGHLQAGVVRDLRKAGQLPVPWRKLALALSRACCEAIRVTGRRSKTMLPVSGSNTGGVTGSLA